MSNKGSNLMPQGDPKVRNANILAKDRAHTIMLAHVGAEGGTHSVDWYRLREELADAISAIILDSSDGISR